MAEQTKKAEDAQKNDKVLITFTKPWSRIAGVILQASALRKRSAW